MNYTFPIAFLFNNFSVTAFMIVAGLTGNSHLAAEIGIVQGATIALFYSFSANARSIILNPAMRSLSASIFRLRLLLIVPLGVVSFYLSARVADIGWALALSIILRRGVEWISELHLSHMEFNDDRETAGRFIALQILLLFLASGCLWIDTPAALWGLFAWALLPLLPSFRFIRKQFETSGYFRVLWNQLLPHFGSTAIIGITVYVFRLLLVIYTGKNEAGDLFTAFAIGGFAGSIFAQVLGPSISLHEERLGRQYFPKIIKSFIFLNLLFGVILLIVAYSDPHILTMTGKSVFFWKALSFSMIGGVVMVFAQVNRYRLLQRYGENDLFGPDVLMNILILLSIPYLYYILGKEALVTLYLMSAVLAFSFYFSAEKGQLTKCFLGLPKEGIRIFIACMLFAPVFFQLGAGIFRDPSMTFSSAGLLSKLPVPLSVPACFAGIFVLGDYRRAYASLSFVFIIFIIMLISTVSSTQAHGMEQEGKFILLTQFILPAFAYVLGQIFITEGNDTRIFERVSLAVLIVIVPLQLFCTWLQGAPFLTPYMYLFSIYQHLQYVPVIFVCVYLLAVYTLWGSQPFKKILFVFTPIMVLYTIASGSILAITTLSVGLCGFVIFSQRLKLNKWVVIVLILVGLIFISILPYVKAGFILRTFQSGVNFIVGTDQQQKTWTERFDYWTYYTKNILSSPKVFFLGHGKPPDRARYPSAHNYYLDLTYHFGFLALFPMLVMIGLTLKMIVTYRHEIFSSSSLLGMTFVVLILLLADNSLKVGLRQPYPGIITFFLWGVLLSKLLSLHETMLTGPAQT